MKIILILVWFFLASCADERQKLEEAKLPKSRGDKSAMIHSTIGTWTVNGLGPESHESQQCSVFIDGLSLRFRLEKMNALKTARDWRVDLDSVQPNENGWVARSIDSDRVPNTYVFVRWEFIQECFAEFSIITFEGSSAGDQSSRFVPKDTLTLIARCSN